MATPEFAMPPRRGHETAPLASPPRARSRRRRPRLGWRHLAVAALVSALVGAAVPVALRAVGQSSAEVSAASLADLAGEYVQAIADGASDRATELVPLSIGRSVAEAALASAWRIQLLDIGDARVDGDAGSVDVLYRVGGTDVVRTLRGTHTAAGWRLTTTLAELPDAAPSDATAQLRVGGVALPTHGQVHLYPGVYRLDVVPGPLFRSGGEAFTVDGDPATVTTVRSASSLMPSFEEQTARLALASLDACRQRADCVIRTAAPFTLAGQVVVLETFDDGNGITLKVPFVARDAAGWEWRDVIVRVALDNRGLPVDWQCASAGAPFVRCGA